MQLPEEDRYSMTNLQILDTICVLLAGRAAEELFMLQMTTGASNDFERATSMARRMVTQWGMSNSMGTMVYGEEEGEVFLGRSITTHKQVSETTMREVDNEIRKIIDSQYAKAKGLLEQNRSKVERMTKALLDWETIDEGQINDIMKGKEPTPPDDLSPPPSPPDSTDTDEEEEEESSEGFVGGEETKAA